MSRTRVIPLGLAATAIAVTVLSIALVSLSRSASALPPAGSDTLGATAQVSATSRLGSETIDFTGVVTIERGASHDDGGDEVQDITLTNIELSGLSVTGFVSIHERPGVDSTGELRSSEPDGELPASSFIDANLEASVPASGFGSPTPFLIYNEMPLHLVAQSDVTAWPPVGVKYQASLVPCARMLRSDLPPESPGAWLPAEICVTAISVTLGPPPTPTSTSTPCGGTCPATATPTGTPRPPTATPRPPTPTPTTLGPENPSFSVAPDGPSGFHPASILRLGSGGPIIVNGNDNFVNAQQISALPFSGTQNTFGFTVESGEPHTFPPGLPLPSGYCIPTSPNTMGGTAWFRFTAPATGPLEVNTHGTLPPMDTVLAVYSGNGIGSLTLLGCNDDSGFPGNDFASQVTGVPVTAGTVYHVQVGGFSSFTGTIVLNVCAPNNPDCGGAGGTGGSSDVSVAIACSALGLGGDGCDAGGDGDQDDIDALSYGQDDQSDDNPIAFSVGPGSLGLADTALEDQTGCSPAQPQADEFTSSRDGMNSLVLEGDGQANGSCPGGFGLGLTETPSSDDLDGLDGHPPEFVDSDLDGSLDGPVFFSLAPGSPSLNPVFSPADILWTIGIGSPGMYASQQDLGLRAGDDIDGLCLLDLGDELARYEPGRDEILFSLAPGSPSLTTLNATGADVLRPGPAMRYRGGELGLRPTDNLDAMKCFHTSGEQSAKVAVGETQLPTFAAWFCDASFAGEVCETKVNIGDTVEWNWVGTAPHTVTHCGASCNNPTNSPLFDSGVMTQNGTFSHRFDTAGTYLYLCQLHAGQLGSIVVNDPDATPPPGTPTPTPPTGTPGDADKNGTVNAIDASLILQFSAGFLNSINPRANVNGGPTNSVDASLILQFVAGLLDDWPP